VSEQTRTRWRRSNRAAACWMLGVFVAAQVGLAIAIDQDLPAIRDPEYVLLETLLRDRMAERPDQPTAMFLGSSRVAHGFDAREAAGDCELVLFNFGVPGSGPFLQSVMMDRLAASGLHTDILFIEVMHHFFNASGVRSLDHSLLDGARLSGNEAIGLLDYGERSRTGPLRRWLYGRALPISRNHAELRDAIQLDAFEPGEGPPPPFHPIDAFGYRLKDIAPEKVPEMTELAHKQYDPFYGDFILDPAPWGKLVKTIGDAQLAGTDVVIVLMPEGSQFRQLATPAMLAGLNEMLRRLREDLGVPVIDARDWLDDTTFYDQHHLLPSGAKMFAKRFGVEALQPALDRRVQRITESR
jgi:Protein of unknown function (DUF1574)